MAGAQLSYHATATHVNSLVTTGPLPDIRPSSPGTPLTGYPPYPRPSLLALLFVWRMQVVLQGPFESADYSPREPWQLPGSV